MRIEYHPDTVTDLTEAIDFYNEQRVGLGDEFRDEIYHRIDRIVANPFLYKPVVSQIRRCFVHRFPFSILYRIIEGELVRVLVIRHHRRHPQFGTARQ